MRFAPCLLFAASLWACTPQAAAPAKAPPTQPPPAASTWKQVEPAKQKQALVPEPAGVPAPDAACAAFATGSSAPCAAPSDERAALARALSTSDALKRDEQLGCLEHAPSFPPGVLRALRAELAPTACADVIVMPLLEPRHPELERRVEDALIALAASGRLARLVQKAPELAPPFDRARFMDFFQRTLKPWIVTQAAAIHDLSTVGPRLTPYAKGVVAIEAGLADMRFVSVVRQVPLPKEISDDAELRDAYYGALDEALEPRKARGRDAALVGLRELGNEGVVFEPRVERARALLSEVYSGRRIDALDHLLVPDLPPLQTSTADQELAARLPTFYAGLLLDKATLDEALLRALITRGLPAAFAARLPPDKLDEPSKLLLARVLFDRGRVYFRAQDFLNSARLSASDEPSPEQALLHALATSLAGGPSDAAELLLRGPYLPKEAVQVAELDRLASQKTAVAGYAAFDAAFLIGLVPSRDAPKFWDDLAKRYDAASRALRDPLQKKNAHEAASAAKDTAKALRAPRGPGATFGRSG